VAGDNYTTYQASWSGSNVGEPNIGPLAGGQFHDHGTNLTGTTQVMFGTVAGTAVDCGQRPAGPGDRPAVGTVRLSISGSPRSPVTSDVAAADRFTYSGCRSNDHLGQPAQWPFGGWDRGDHAPART